MRYAVPCHQAAGLRGSLCAGCLGAAISRWRTPGPLPGELPRIPAALWHSGLCAQPGAGHWWISDDPADRAKAIAICRACPVRAHVCLPFVMEQPDLGGDVIYVALDLAGPRALRARGLRRSAI